VAQSVRDGQGDVDCNRSDIMAVSMVMHKLQRFSVVYTFWQLTTVHSSTDSHDIFISNKRLSKTYMLFNPFISYHTLCPILCTISYMIKCPFDNCAL
jgi:hypothetical protein